MFSRHKYKENIPLDSIKDPVGSIKYDGGHFFMRFDAQGKPAFISRRMSVHGHYPDRTEKLPQFHDILLPEYAGAVISTELIHTGHDPKAVESHPVVSGLLNSLPPKAYAEQTILGPIRAVLLDVRHPTINTYSEKMQYLKDLETKISKPFLIFTPELKIGKSEIENLINSTKEEGREGAIITSLTTPESNNPRLKIKHLNTYNLKVIGVLQEYDIYGNPKESMGAYQLADRTGRHVGDVGIGFTRDMRKEAWKNKKRELGKLVQVKASPPHGKGDRKLRFPKYNGEGDGNLDIVE